MLVSIFTTKTMSMSLTNASHTMTSVVMGMTGTTRFVLLPLIASNPSHHPCPNKRYVTRRTTLNHTRHVVNVELEVGDAEVAAVLVQVHLVWVHSGQVQHILRKPHQGQLDHQLCGAKGQHPKGRNNDNHNSGHFYNVVSH